MIRSRNSPNGRGPRVRRDQANTSGTKVRNVHARVPRDEHTNYEELTMPHTTGRPISSVMTPRVLSLGLDATVAAAADAMRANDIGDILVMDGDQIRGVVTDRDLVVRAVAEGKDPELTTVEEVYSPDVVSVSPDDDVATAVHLMREHAVRRLPVVGADGHAHGIVTIGDLAISQDPHSALATISTAAPNN
jgi:CBS domain-containing protein